LTVTGVQTCALPIYPLELHRSGARQRVDAALRGGVVALPEIAEQPAQRSGVDDAAALALHFEDPSCRLRDQEGALEMHVDHQVRSEERRVGKECRAG